MLRPERRPVHPGEDKLAEPPVADEAAERGQRQRGKIRVVGRRERCEALPAALDVEDGCAVHEDDLGAGRPLERPPVVVAAAGPRERRAVRLGRVGGREQVHAGPSRFRLADGPQPVDRAGEGELGGPEPVDEVAAPDPTGLLERPQDRVDAGEAAVDALGDDGLAGQHAVAVEEDERLGFVSIRGGAGAPAATLLVGAGTAEVKEERLRIGHDAAAAVQAAAKGGVLPGGGAAEVGAIPAVARCKETLSGMAVYGAETVMTALRKPLAQIVANAGFNPLEKVAQVMAQQAATRNHALAIDCDTGEIADMLKLGVLDPAPVKVSALRTAAEVAEAILRIGVVIRMRTTEKDAGGAETSSGGLTSC